MFIRKMRWKNEEEEESWCNEWAIVKLLTRKRTEKWVIFFKLFFFYYLSKIRIQIRINIKSGFWIRINIKVGSRSASTKKWNPDPHRILLDPPHC